MLAAGFEMDGEKFGGDRRIHADAARRWSQKKPSIVAASSMRWGDRWCLKNNQRTVVPCRSSTCAPVRRLMPCYPHGCPVELGATGAGGDVVHGRLCACDAG